MLLLSTISGYFIMLFLLLLLLLLQDNKRKAENTRKIYLLLILIIIVIGSRTTSWPKNRDIIYYVENISNFGAENRAMARERESTILLRNDKNNAVAWCTSGFSWCKTIKVCVSFAQWNFLCRLRCLVL